MAIRRSGRAGGGRRSHVRSNTTVGILNMLQECPPRKGWRNRQCYGEARALKHRSLGLTGRNPLGRKPGPVRIAVPRLVGCLVGFRLECGGTMFSCQGLLPRESKGGKADGVAPMAAGGGEAKASCRKLTVGAGAGGGGEFAKRSLCMVHAGRSGLDSGWAGSKLVTGNRRILFSARGEGDCFLSACGLGAELFFSHVTPPLAHVLAWRAERCLSAVCSSGSRSGPNSPRAGFGFRFGTSETGIISSGPGVEICQKKKRTLMRWAYIFYVLVLGQPVDLLDGALGPPLHGGVYSFTATLSCLGVGVSRGRFPLCARMYVHTWRWINGDRFVPFVRSTLQKEPSRLGPAQVQPT